MRFGIFLRCTSGLHSGYIPGIILTRGAAAAVYLLHTGIYLVYDAATAI